MSDEPATRWQSRAACRGYPTDWWFPPHAGNAGENTAADVYARARLVCADCPVRHDCLNVALERNEQHGMWGGLALKQRRQLKAAPGGMKTTPPVVCAECGRVFTGHPLGPRATYCSNACRNRAYRRRRYVA